MDDELDDIKNTNNYLSEQFISKFPYNFEQLNKQIKFLNHLAGN